MSISVATPAPLPNLPSFETLTRLNPDDVVISLAVGEYALAAETPYERHQRIELAHSIRKMEESAVYERKPACPILEYLRELAALQDTYEDEQRAIKALYSTFGVFISLRTCTLCEGIFNGETMMETGCCDAYICEGCLLSGQSCDCPPSPEMVAEYGAKEATWEAIDEAEKRLVAERVLG